MRRLLYCFILLVGLTACDNELDLTSDWQDIPAVWGILNASDSIHYVRVERAYLDPERNALEVAQIADSIYYTDAVSVRLNVRGTGRTFELERVNATDLGLERQDGIFVTEPNILYRISNEELELEGGEILEFTLERNNGLPAVTAETTVLRPIDKGVNQSPAVTVGFEPGRESNFTFRPPSEAKVFEVVFEINLLEWVPGNFDNAEERVIRWVLDGNVVNPNGSSDFQTVGVNVPGGEFFTVLANALDRESDLRRRVVSLDYIVTGAGSAFREFSRVRQANTGITGAQEVPTFTNLSEGVGIFTSVSRYVQEGILINSRTEQELVDGTITGDFNFSQ